MANLELTQTEADILFAMEKHRVDSKQYEFSCIHEPTTVPLVSIDKREQFLLDLSRGKIEMARVKFQNRTRKVIVLARLDLSGRLHRNPDGMELTCPHLHLYREGYG